MAHRLARGLRGAVQNLVFQQLFKPFNQFSKSSTRNYASELMRRSAVEDNIFRRIRNEIQYEIDRSHALEPVPEFNSFKVDERPGEKWIRLRGKYGEDEDIVIEVTMFDAAVMKKTDDADDIRVHASMIVNIFKGKNDDVLEFVCSAWPDRIRIHNVLASCHDKLNDRTYKGPKFKELDDELQDALYYFLEERGIDDRLAEFLNKYMNIKEKKEYLFWMENVMSFIQKQK